MVDRPFYLSTQRMPVARQRRTTTTVLSGTAVIAVTYGLGRYAYGLFVPQLAAALDLSATATGTVGGLSHVGYALGLLAAPAVVRRVGPGRAAVGAAVAAAVGLGSVAASVGPATLGAAILVAGTASGLASPALADLVVRRLAPDERASGQTWINSGTSLGLAVSAPPLLFALPWRSVWAAFAVTALAVAAVAWRTLARDRHRAPRPRAATTGADGTAAADRDHRRLLTYAVVLGATSAAYWTFSRQQVLEQGTSEVWSVAFWIVIGVFGLLGGSAGATADRRGWALASRRWALVWAGSLGALAVPGLPAPVAVVSAAGFGAAYMALTGLTILWAVSRQAGGAAAGVRAAFLALGVGQAIATPVAGLSADGWGLSATFALSAVGSLALLVIPPTPTVRSTSTDEEVPCHRTRRSTTWR